jgi:acyl-CoA synthetase (AMP-forming)/AMP-acid ligase II
MYPTIAETLELTAQKYPDKPGLIYPYRDQHWTYSEFDDRANQLANVLRDLGIEKGDRVATVLFNGSEQILTVFACSKIGAVFTPLNFRLPAGEIEFNLNDGGADVVSCDESTVETVEAGRPDREAVSG